MKTRNPQNDGQLAATPVEPKPGELQPPAASPQTQSTFQQARGAAEIRLQGEIIFPPNIPAEAAQTRIHAKQKREAYRKLVKEKLAASKQKAQILSGDYLEFLRKKIKREHPDERVPERSARGLVRFLPHFDWRLSGAVPAVRDQTKKRCGACWAFAATAAYESSLMKNQNRYKLATAPEHSGGSLAITQVGISVQCVLDCVSKGDCAGGWPGRAFDHFVENGIPIKIEEGGMPIDDRDFIGKKRPCTGHYESGLIVKAIAWDYVHADPEKIPSVKKMKEALLEHGPLVVFVTFTEAFKNYPEKGEIFKQRHRADVNHTVLLTGWDDAKKAWIIQNSFGTKWGISCLHNKAFSDPFLLGQVINMEREKGCMYIQWYSNHVGKYAMWVEAPFELGAFVQSGNAEQPAWPQNPL